MTKEEKRRIKEGKKMAKLRAKEARKAEKMRAKQERRAAKEAKKNGNQKFGSVEERSFPVKEEVKTDNVTETENVGTDVTKPAPEAEVKSEDASSSVSSDDAVEPQDESENKERHRNYHVSFREDGKWQVKFAKGSKALKLFDTQAEAIAFAKEKAENQDGSITIHKKDGKIRKQRYDRQ